MSSSEEIARLMKDAAESLKRDPKAAIAKLESAEEIAATLGDEHQTAMVEEELSRAWNRRKSAARSLRFARRATTRAPDRKAAWTTLAKLCELLAIRMPADRKEARAHALFRGAATAFKKAASLTKDAEDRHWLMDLAADAARQAKPKH